MEFNFLLLFTNLALLPKVALAVPPPDLNFADQSVFVFPSSYAIFLILAIPFVIAGFISKAKLFNLGKVLPATFIGVSILLFLTIGTKIYLAQNDRTAYENWLKESKKNSELLEIKKEIPPPVDPPEKPNLPIESVRNYFDLHSSEPNFVTNDEFKKLIDSKEASYILDAREDEEYEIGRFPGSTHIRFPDVKDGRWEELPKDKTVYVFCWSGIRGKEAVEFLRTKKVLAKFVEKGASGWFEYGGLWLGGVSFKNTYTAKQYNVVYSNIETKQYVSEGILLIDSRDPQHSAKKKIPGSLAFPVFHTPTKDFQNIFDQVPKDAKIITICDDYVSCFDARISGLKLERQGAVFLGRYASPWQY